MADHFSALKECNRFVCDLSSRLALTLTVVSIINFCQWMLAKNAGLIVLPLVCEKRRNLMKLNINWLSVVFVILNLRRNECSNALNISLHFFYGKNIKIELGLGSILASNTGRLGEDVGGPAPKNLGISWGYSNNNCYISTSLPAYLSGGPSPTAARPELLAVQIL